jgi:hypothetical protein
MRALENIDDTPGELIKGRIRSCSGDYNIKNLKITMPELLEKIQNLGIK